MARTATRSRGPARRALSRREPGRNSGRPRDHEVVDERQALPDHASTAAELVGTTSRRGRVTTGVIRMLGDRLVVRQVLP